MWKHEECGYTGLAPPHTQVCNKVPCKKPTAARVAAFTRAFVAKNAAWFSDLQVNMEAALRIFPAEHLQKNGQQSIRLRYCCRHEGPKRVAKRSESVSRRPQDCPRCPKRAQQAVDGPQGLQWQTRGAHDNPRGPQDSPEESQDPQEAPPRPPKDAQEARKRPPRGPKETPRRSQSVTPMARSPLT